MHAEEIASLAMSVFYAHKKSGMHGVHVGLSDRPKHIKVMCLFSIFKFLRCWLKMPDTTVADKRLLLTRKQMLLWTRACLV